MMIRTFPATRFSPMAVLVSMSLLTLSGCATKEFVQQEVGGVNSRIDTLHGLLNTVSQRIDGNSVRLNRSESRLGQTEQTATTLSTRIDGNLAGLAGANHRLDSLAGELATADGRIAANVAEIARAHQRLDATESQVQASRRRLEGTVAGLVMAENRLVEAEASLRSMSQAAPVAVETIAQVEKEVQQTVVAQPLTHTGVVDAVPAPTLGAANNRLDGIAALIATANQRIVANSQAIDSVTARLGSVESGLGETRKRTEAGELALTAANARIDSVHSNLVETKEAVAAQAAAIVTVDKRVEDVTSALTETNSRLGGGDKGLMATAAHLAQLEGAIKLETERLSRHEAAAIADSGAFKRTLDAFGATLDGSSQRLDMADKTLADTSERVALLQTAVKDQGGRLKQNEEGLTQTGAQVGQAIAAIKDHEERMLRNETAAVAVSATAKEALERAIAAGHLAEGKLVYETVMSAELAKFELEKSKLSTSSKQALTNFANQLQTDNKSIFIEIQGHTDSSGSSSLNKRLARERAEAVRTFLHGNLGVPLHRMAVVSYGESRPIADNDTAEGRQQNRRVVLVVLK